MILAQWADQLHARAVTELAAGRTGLHVADALAAFQAGRRTAEGQALWRFYAGRAGGSERECRVCLAAAASAVIRMTECDDIHLSSCVTPGAVVVPVALALNEDASRLHPAIDAGYSVGIAIGEGLGGPAALEQGVWPTLLAAPAMAAATAAISVGLDRHRTAHAMSLALAGWSGRLGRPAGVPSGRWLLLGEAVLKGCHAAFAAANGFKGDPGLLAAGWLEAQGAPTTDEGGLPQRLRPAAAARVGFKPFVTARQGANAVAAFQAILTKLGTTRTIKHVEVGLPPANLAVATRPLASADRLSTIANVGFQIACAALRPAALYDVERAGQPEPGLAAFAKRVSVVPDPGLERHLPEAWPARVRVVAEDATMEEECLRLPGDPGEPEPEALLSAKFTRLCGPEQADELLALGAGLAGPEPNLALARAWRLIQDATKSEPLAVELRSCLA